jgi:V8-like Glu-specific endopeptidase
MLRRASLTLCCAALAACGPELAPPRAVGASRDAVLNGAASFDDPSVFVLYGQYPDGSGYICSSTLIGRHTLLTASHCLEKSDTGQSAALYATNAINIDSQSAVWIDVVAAHQHPSFNPSSITNDIAAVKLASAPPVPLKAWSTTALTSADVGKKLRVVGYGITATNADDSGLKRSGQTQLDAVLDTQFKFGTTGQGASGTCSGDSGGPAFLTGADGVERVIGVTSFHSGGCGNNTDTRVDHYAAQVQLWLKEFEAVAATCAGGDTCVSTGCTTPDPDCDCLTDGVCSTTCTTGKDADCSSTCGADGLCSAFACGTADPDCQALGADCGFADQCAGRLCITSAQHLVQPYCSKSCQSQGDCGDGFACNAHQCEYAVKPEKHDGEACTPGTDFCADANEFCGSTSTQPTTHCARGCYEAADCDGLQACVDAPESGVPGICVPILEVPRLVVEEYPAAKGCQSVGGGVSVLAAALALLLRARRRVEG